MVLLQYPSHVRTSKRPGEMQSHTACGDKTHRTSSQAGTHTTPPSRDRTDTQTQTQVPQMSHPPPSHLCPVRYGISPARFRLVPPSLSFFFFYLSYVGHKEGHPGDKEHAQQDAQGQAGLQSLPAMLGGQTPTVSGLHPWAWCPGHLWKEKPLKLADLHHRLNLNPNTRRSPSIPAIN